MSKYDLLALPVIDPEGVLVGIITIDDVVDRLKERPAPPPEGPLIAPAVRRRRVRPAALDWRRRLTLFLAVLGPGIITANVDNDAGGIATYSIAGAHFGYSLLWTMVPITLALIVVQEMSARLGAITGQGARRPDPRELRPADDLLPPRRPSS